jgi:hypothetical protein
MAEVLATPPHEYGVLQAEYNRSKLRDKAEECQTYTSSSKTSSFRI